MQQQVAAASSSAAREAEVIAQVQLDTLNKAADFANIVRSGRVNGNGSGALVVADEAELALAIEKKKQSLRGGETAVMIAATVRARATERAKRFGQLLSAVAQARYDPDKQINSSVWDLMQRRVAVFVGAGIPHHKSTPMHSTARLLLPPLSFVRLHAYSAYERTLCRPVPRDNGRPRSSMPTDRPYIT